MKVGIYGFENEGLLGVLFTSAQHLGYDVKWRRHDVFTADQTEDFNMVIINGLRKQYRVIRDAYNAKGIPVVVSDLGYMNRALGYYQVGLNQLGWVPAFRCQSDRYKQQGIAYKPFQFNKNGHVLVCGQMPGDAAHNLDEDGLKAFFENTIAEIRKNTNKKIVWRPHPSAQFAITGADETSTKEQLADDLAGCAFMVTYNSTSGIGALLAGVPVFCSDTAFYKELANDLDFEIPVQYPEEKDFTDFFSRLAYGQWTLEEITSGDALKFIQYALSGKGDIKNDIDSTIPDGEQRSSEPDDTSPDGTIYPLGSEGSEPALSGDSPDSTYSADELNGDNSPKTVRKNVTKSSAKKA